MDVLEEVLEHSPLHPGLRGNTNAGLHVCVRSICQVRYKQTDSPLLRDSSQRRGGALASLLLVAMPFAPSNVRSLLVKTCRALPISSGPSHRLSDELRHVAQQGVMILARDNRVVTDAEVHPKSDPGCPSTLIEPNKLYSYTIRAVSYTHLTLPTKLEV